MSKMMRHHRELTEGKGKCSAPVYSGGCPAGFCDEDAYGEPPESEMVYHAGKGHNVRADNRYDGYVPGLACPGHGGPKLKEISHSGDPCKYCGQPHDGVEKGPCPELVNKI